MPSGARTTPLSPRSITPARPAACAQAEELYIAARDGVAQRVAELLNENTPTTFADDCGKGPLHVAAENGHWGIVEELLKRGADIDAKSKVSPEIFAQLSVCQFY